MSLKDVIIDSLRYLTYAGKIEARNKKNSPHALPRSVEISIFARYDDLLDKYHFKL